MATIREKGPYQWQVQIRRKGWPFQTATFRTKKDAEAWARQSEHAMDRGLFVDQSAGRETTLSQASASTSSWQMRRACQQSSKTLAPRPQASHP